MAAFTSLPTDIVQLILQHIVDRARSGIKAAKVKIVLLAVCGEWRAIVIPMFYSFARLYGNTGDEVGSQSSRAYFESQSNIDLILRNGYGNCVKHFLYSPEENELAVGSLIFMARILNINADNCPELDSLMDYDDNDSNIQMDWERNHVLVAEKIATTLATKLPNIKQLSLYIQSTHGIEICFSLALVDCFAEKLVEFTYYGSLDFPNKQPMLGLKTVHLILTANNESHAYPTICPRSIQKLTVVANNIPFNWGIFSINENPEIIVFEQLAHLRCQHFTNSADGAHSSIDRRLQFPNIKKMVAHNTTLSADTVQQQLCSGLRMLDYNNKLPKLLELSQLNLSSLTSLNLVLDNVNDIVEDEFVARTNTLFSRLKRIPTVKAEISREFSSHDRDNIYWPNLTRLVLNVIMVHSNIFVAVLNMPDLVYIEIKEKYRRPMEFNSAAIYFENLRNNYAKPSRSNITTLKIEGEQNSCNQLSSSIQVLKWYWPKLTTIDICH